MGSQQVFCLRWSNHQSNMLSVFDELLQTETLVDVTLACEGLSLKAHKVVLSACSPYFQTLFLQNPCKHPIVILKDIKYNELKALIDFMYKGEVNVTQEQLSTLLKSAETLKIKGLAEVTGGVNGQQQNQDRTSDRVHPGNNDRRPYSVPPSQLPPSDSRSSSPPASASGQLSSSRSLHSPPTKRKKMKTKRRFSEATHSDDNSEPIEVCGSPVMLETKVEVEAESADNVPSRSSDHDDHTDQPSDLQTDSNQESLDNYTNQGPTNQFNDDYVPIGEPMTASSSTPLSLIHKLKRSPGPSTSGGGSIQGYIKSGISNKYTTLGGLLLPSQNWDLHCKPIKREREPISSSLEVDIKYEQTLLEFAAQAAAAASDNTCPVCGITFRYRNNLYRHRRTHCDTRIRHGCHLCGKTFSRKDTLQLHARVKHQVQDMPEPGRLDGPSPFGEVQSETPAKERSEGSSHFEDIKLEKAKDEEKSGEQWPTHFLGVVKSESISKCE